MPRLALPAVLLLAAAGCRGKDTPEKVMADAVAAHDEASALLEAGPAGDAKDEAKVDALTARFEALTQRKTALPPLTKEAAAKLKEKVGERYKQADARWTRAIQGPAGRTYPDSFRMAFFRLSVARNRFDLAEFGVPEPNRPPAFQQVPPAGPPARPPAGFAPPPPPPPLADRARRVVDKHGADRVVTVVVDGVPHAKTDAVRRRLQALLGATDTTSSGTGTRITVVLGPVPDLDAAAGRIDFGTVTGVDRAARTVAVAGDPGKLD